MGNGIDLFDTIVVHDLKACVHSSFFLWIRILIKVTSFIDYLGFQDTKKLPIFYSN